LLHPFGAPRVNRRCGAGLRLVPIPPLDVLGEPGGAPRSRLPRAFGRRRRLRIETFAGGIILALLIEPILARGFPCIAALIRALILALELFPALLRTIRAAISVSAVAPQVNVEFLPAFQADAFA
jgi:hypothetical protein